MRKTDKNNKRKNEVVLTFDDGPDPDVTPKILDILKKENIKAVFFVLGESVASEKNIEIIKRINAEGHIIGNHTYSHKNLVRLTDEEIKTEILKTEELIKSFLSSPKLLRPPFGAINIRVNRILSELGYLPVMWNVDTMDWKTKNTGWVKNAAELIGEYNIILMHDVHETTMQNLPLLINEIRKKKNFEFINYL